MQSIKDDAPNLFGPKGMDLSIYADNVTFRDPITKYDDIQVQCSLRVYRHGPEPLCVQRCPLASGNATHAPMTPKPEKA